MGLRKAQFPYDWIDVRHLRSTGPLFARAPRRAAKPNDGFAYVEERIIDPASGAWMGEYRWVRAQTDSPPPAEGE